MRSGWEGRKRQRILGKKEFCELEVEKARWPGGRRARDEAEEVVWY